VLAPAAAIDDQAAPLAMACWQLWTRHENVLIFLHYFFDLLIFF
jgi:hypothetical protein